MDFNVTNDRRYPKYIYIDKIWVVMTHATQWAATSIHRVIILNRGSMPRKRTERKWCEFSRPECATSQRDALETACSLANGPSWGGGGGARRSSGIAASPISLLSMGGVCGRSLTAGKILFTGGQTCCLYLVLWLCASIPATPKFRLLSFQKFDSSHSKISIPAIPKFRFLPFQNSKEISDTLCHIWSLSQTVYLDRNTSIALQFRGSFAYSHREQSIVPKYISSHS